jgi:inosose dehydratase
MPGVKPPAPLIALSPASWGISDQPGWGHQLEAERVLAEASALRAAAIEAGPSGFLPDRSEEARAMLKRHHLGVVAGPVDAVLHHHDIRGPELFYIDGHAGWLAALKAEMLVLTPIASRDGTGDGADLSSTAWAHMLHSIGSVQHVCARHRLKLAVQPRFGSMIQRPADIERLLVGTEAGLCLDIGHLLLAGADPLDVLELAAGRVQLVHLTDVDRDVAREVRDHGLDFAEGVSQGLFKPLGTGDSGADRVVEALRQSKYRGWYTIESDIRLASIEYRPLGGVSRSLDYLRRLLA